MTDRFDRIQATLKAGLQPESMELIDDSHKHADHAGAKSGGGHFDLTIVSAAFNGLNAVQRHQLIYKTLGEMMQTDIHALGIQAFSPDEF